MKSISYKTVLSAKLYLLLFIIVVFISSKINGQTVNLDSLNKVVNENHLSGLALIQKGSKIEGLKKFYTAVEAFREIDYELAEKRDSLKTVIEGWLKINPQSPLINYLMGNIIYLTKRDSIALAMAKNYFNKSILLEPSFISPYRGLSSVAQFEKNDEEAIRNYRKILEIDSTHYSTYLRFASFLARLGNVDESEALLNKVIANDTSGNNKVWASLGLADNKKSYDEKKKLYYSALLFANTQSDSIIIYQRIMSAMVKENTQEFITIADRLLTSKIGKVRELRMGILSNYFEYLKKNSPDGILEFANKIMEEDNPIVIFMAGVHLTYQKKDYENALKILLKAYDITSSESVYETISFGRKDKERLEKTAAKFKYGSVSKVIGKTYIELKNYQKAEEFLLKALPYTEAFRDYEPYTLLSKIKEEEGNIKEAVNYLVKALAIQDVTENRKKLEELKSKLGNEDNSSELISKEREKNAIAAKDFTLKTMDGKLFRLSDQKGKVVLLDFWATWCGPCVAALPQMIKLFEKYSGNSNVVFHSIDVDESEKTIKDFLTKKNYSFNILLANGTDVQKEYGVTAIPTLFIIDKLGKIQFKHIGFSKEENIVESLSKEIDELLMTN